MSKETVIVKKWISLCKEKPYFIKGTEEDYDFMIAIKNAPDFFVIDNNAIFSTQLLINFWENEIRRREVTNKTIDLDVIISEGIKNFSKKYKTIHPNIVNSNNQNVEYFQGIKEPSVNESAVSNNPKLISIKNFVKMWVIKRLDHIEFENIYGKDVLMYKPDIEKSEKVLTTVNSLIDDLLSRSYGFKDIKPINNLEVPGIYTIIYDGNDFPFKEAKEYVKLRPIIYAGQSNNLKKELTKIVTGKGLGVNKFLSAISNILVYTKTVKVANHKRHSQKTKENIRTWLKENLKYSYKIYQKDKPKNKELLKQDYKLLLYTKAPILNIDNEANIFSYKLRNIDYVKQKYTERHDGGGRIGLRR